MSSSRTLILLRHAKAEPPGTDIDKMRSLALRGRKQANELGTILAEHHLIPDAVLCSASLRTRQTWELLSGSLSEATSDRSDRYDPRTVILDDLYQASVAQLLALVVEHSRDDECVLVVGHEPVISMTADYLAGPDSDPAAVAQVRVGVPTASACILRADAHWSDWQRNVSRLDAVIRPTA